MMKTILKTNISFICSTLFTFIAFVIVNAQDTGKWEILNEGIKGCPSDINFVSENIGWLSGANTLSKTEDGGETWIAIPLDENWHFRKFDFLNESIGWAVGGYNNEIDVWKNTITKSIDGGQTWFIQKEFTDSYNLHVVNDSTVYAVGNSRIDDVNNGLILKTSNGGTNWIDISAELTDKRLESIWFVDPEVGVITGRYYDDNTESDKGLILKTDDGGITWDENIISDFRYISNLQFINDSTGYFLAANDESHYFLCATTDTFNTWTIKTQSTYQIRSYFVLDNETIFAVMDDSASTNVMKSMNNGLTWEKKQTIQGGNKLYFTSRNAGFIINGPAGRGGCANIGYYRSTDDGESWRIYKINSSLVDIFFIDENSGFAFEIRYIGDHGYHSSIGDLFFTADGGQSWQHNFSYIEFDSGNPFSIVISFNESAGIIVAGGKIFKTFDIGVNWTVSYDNYGDSTGYSFYGSDISFLNEQIIYAVGAGSWSEDSSGASVLGTTDSGENWDLIWKYPDTEVYNYSLKSIHVVNSTAWAVGTSGLVVKSVDSDSFKIINANTDLPLNDVFFSDENHGWIAGGYLNDQDFQSILLKTINGSENWQEIRFQEYLINDMFFENSLHGWAVGNDTSRSGIILETEDGGDSWNVQVEGLSASLTALHFKDGFGWAVGDNGLVLRTEDGASWVDHNTGKIYPNKFSLSQNYPNPFNPSTKIKFTLPKTDKVKIEIYNTLGQRVDILLNQYMKAGHHEVEFNAQQLSSGIYFYRIEASEFQDVKKMILLR